MDSECPQGWELHLLCGQPVPTCSVPGCALFGAQMLFFFPCQDGFFCRLFTRDAKNACSDNDNKYCASGSSLHTHPLKDKVVNFPVAS